MNYLISIFAGILQGLTEFLPISSSGHLVILHDLFGFNFSDNLAFDVVLHLGTLLALLIFFWSDIVKYLKAFFQSFKQWNLRNDINQRLAWFLLVATTPAAIAGYLWEEQIESVLRSSQVVVFTLISVGLLIYLADKFSAKTKNITDLKWSGALIIGVAQAIALIPGVSRSGITIIAGLSQKLNRAAAAKFAFLLSIPIVFGAGSKKLIDLFSNQIVNSADLIALLLGFLSSVITGYLCIKYFLRFLESHSLKVFAYYRIILGIIILVMLTI